MGPGWVEGGAGLCGLWERVGARGGGGVDMRVDEFGDVVERGGEGVREEGGCREEGGGWWGCVGGYCCWGSGEDAVVD